MTHPRRLRKHRLRERVYRADGWRCVYCGATEALTLDHVLPRSRGGRLAYGNLVTACAPCNRRRGDTPVDEWVRAIHAKAR